LYAIKRAAKKQYEQSGWLSLVNVSQLGYDTLTSFMIMHLTLKGAAYEPIASA